MFFSTIPTSLINVANSSHPFSFNFDLLLCFSGVKTKTLVVIGLGLITRLDCHEERLLLLQYIVSHNIKMQSKSQRSLAESLGLSQYIFNRKIR